MNSFDNINVEFRRAIDLLADGIDCKQLDRVLDGLMNPYGKDAAERTPLVRGMLEAPHYS